MTDSETFTEIAKKSSKTPREARGSWSEGEVRRLIDLWSGSTIEDISEALGRSSSAISVKASRLGLPPRHKSKTFDDPYNPANKPSKARVRPCLSCQTPFYSEGPHHRICDKCKDTETWRSGRW